MGATAVSQHLDRDTRAAIEAEARACGFELAAFASVPAASSEEARADAARFDQWVSAGRAAGMEWLKRATPDGDLIRGDLLRSLPWARSVLVCAVNYNVPTTPRSTDAAPAGSGWIARYAWSGAGSAGQNNGADEPLPTPASDYHDVLLARLRHVEAALLERCPGVETRAYVDTGPLPERSFAVRAGLGWIGKNTCLLHQEHGSWLLLAVLITSLELAPDAAAGLPPRDLCGRCTRCIDACPTGAILLPTAEAPTRQLDSSRCIAYLTIEHKAAIPEELRSGLGRHVFGCDICQDVCPWNDRQQRLAAGSPRDPAPRDPAPLAPLLPVREALINPDLDWLASLDGPAFNRWFRGSPLERTRRKRILRNVAIAMGNSGLSRYRARLDQWASGSGDAADPVLADAAAWALRRLDASATDTSEAASTDAPLH